MSPGTILLLSLLLGSWLRQANVGKLHVSSVMSNTLHYTTPSAQLQSRQQYLTTASSERWAAPTDHCQLRVLEQKCSSSIRQLIHSLAESPDERFQSFLVDVEGSLDHIGRDGWIGAQKGRDALRSSWVLAVKGRKRSSLSLSNFQLEMYQAFREDEQITFLPVKQIKPNQATNIRLLETNRRSSTLNHKSFPQIIAKLLALSVLPLFIPNYCDKMNQKQH